MKRRNKPCSVDGKVIFDELATFRVSGAKQICLGMWLENTIFGYTYFSYVSGA